LSASRARDRGAGGRARELVDQVAGARRVGGIVDPHLGTRLVHGQLARDAGSVGVEHAGADAAPREQVDEEVRLGKVGGGVDLLQNLTDTMPLTPSCFTPLRPSTW